MLANFSQDYFVKLIFSLVAFIMALIISLILNKSIDLFFSGVSRTISRETLLARTHTIRSLLKNIIEVVIFLIVILIILSKWNVDIVPILTGAGILGLAVSFGAQTLVKDIISGFFIIAENQFCVGDKIKVGDREGKVSRITLRLTVLEDNKGNLVYIPNSQVLIVVKYKNNA